MTTRMRNAKAKIALIKSSRNDRLREKEALRILQRFVAADDRGVDFSYPQPYCRSAVAHYKEGK